MFNRVKSILVIGVALGLILSCMGAMLLIAIGSEPDKVFPHRAIPPEIDLDRKNYKSYQLSQISGATLWRNQDEEDKREFGLIIGTSSVRTNLDPVLFRESRGKDMEWLVTGQLGPSLIPIRQVLQLMTEFPDFQPKEIILGLHPYMLNGYEQWHPAANREGRKTISERLRQISAHTRVYISDTLFLVRVRIFKVLGTAHFPVVIRPIPNPWWPLRSNLKENYDEAQWEKDKLLGAADWALSGVKYKADSEGMYEFNLVLDTLIKRWDVPITIVLMPQAPYFNRDMPTEAYTLMSDLVRERYQDKICLLDLRGIYDETHFFDAAHLNNLSVKKFSLDFGRIYSESLEGDCRTSKGLNTGF